MNNWQTVALGDVCTLLNGRAYKKNELLSEGKYPVLRVGNFFSNRKWYYSDLELEENKYCDNGDLLYAWSASFGPRIWEGEKVIYHYHIWKTKLDEKRINKRFLYYWFDWDTNQIKSDHGAGSTMIHVTKSSMEKRKLRLPPLPEQKRIVAILDKAFEGIDTAIANTEKNLANARELFESYRISTFKTNYIKWPSHKLGDLTAVQSGGTPLKSVKEYWSDGNIAWYSSGELNDLYTVAPDKMITQQGLKNSNARLFPVGSLLIGMYDTAALKMSILDREATFNQAVAGAMPKSNINLEFIMHAINATKDEILSRRRGVRQKNLSLGKIKDIDIPLPALEQQDAIVKELMSISDETHRLESVYRQKLTALSELKQSLLNKAFSGELTTIKDDELRTEEVA